MANYTKTTNFAAKDALSPGNASKVVKGTEIDTEFTNIATAISTKADLSSPTFTGTPTLPTGTIGTTQSYGNSSTALATAHGPSPPHLPSASSRLRRLAAAATLLRRL